MKEIIFKWMDEHLPSQFTCRSMDDLLSVDVKIQQLIEFHIRKEIIELFLENPLTIDSKIKHYFSNLVYEGNQEEFQGYETDYNFKMILKTVIQRFNLQKEFIIKL